MTGIWGIYRGLAVRAIQSEMVRPVRIAIVGAPEASERLKARLIADHAQAGLDVPEMVLVLRSAKADMILDAGVHHGADDFALAGALAAMTSGQHPAQIGLARALPMARAATIEQMIRSTSLVNARFAALSALPGIIPMLDWLLPAVSAGDMVVLMRNQMTLLLRIAAIYGRPPDLKERLPELLPVAGGAFGWRAIAREMVGFVPGGAGVGVKAAIAYAGTFATGKAADAYYRSTITGVRNY
jgi:uncharacterized protein (DUF697 family)